MNKKLHSALEIANMRLPGLPATKSNVISRAEKEGWYFEEAKGVGGTRKLYEVPERYVQQEGPAHAPTAKSPPPVTYLPVATIAAGGPLVDPVKLEMAIRALGEWEAERGLTLPAERRPAVIALLYDYLQKNEGVQEGKDLLSFVLRAVG